MFVPELADAPVSEAELVDTVHENVVPVTLLVSAIPVVPPEQKVCAAGVAVTTGLGLTVTTTATGVPAQPAAVGVTV
jgi:hypothetical protein